MSEPDSIAESLRLTGANAHKYGTELKSQRFQMLEDIAQEMSVDLVFPTHFEVAFTLRKVLQEPNLTADRLALFVELDPLVALKVLQIANSQTAVIAGSYVFNLSGAIERIGLQQAKSAILIQVNRQLLLSRNMVRFSQLSRHLWDHSLKSAVASRVLARHHPHSRINPDEAMIAGLVHDIGAFYMLYRASQYPELVERPDTVKYLIIQWHEDIGLSLLRLFGLPESLAQAMVNHDLWRASSKFLKTLGDFVHAGNIMAGAQFEWEHQDGMAPESSEYDEYLQYFSHLIPEVESESNAIRAKLA